MSKPDASPNILFLMTDQHRWDCLGRARPEVKTPHLDALAARGVWFDQAVCQNPQCVPSRYSLTTGLYPSQIGVRNNNQAIQSDDLMPVPTLFQRLQAAGYLTIGCGKTHWYMPTRPGRDIPPAARSTRGFDWRYMSGSANTMWHEPHTVFHREDEPDTAARAEAWRRTVSPNSGGESFDGYQGRVADCTGAEMREGWLTTKSIEALQRAKGRGGPWHLYLSLEAPHAPLEVPRDMAHLYSLDDVPDVDLPPEGASLPRHYNMYHSDEIMARWTALPERERREVWRRYYTLCTYVDAQFGRVFEHLERSGELENTLVLFTSDHGESLGERWRFSKYSFYEASVRVPLIVAGPGVEPARAGARDSRCAELVDIVPTLLEAAGLPHPQELPGESLLRPSHRRGGFAEFHSHGFEEILHAPAYMWRTPEWKLILFFDGYLDAARRGDGPVWGELYDLRADPGERVNLYEQAEHLAVRERLTREMLYQLAINWSHFPRHASHSRNR